MNFWMLAGELLKRRRGGAAAAGAGGDQRHEGAQADGLQQFLADFDLERAVAVGLRRQRNADRVADALLQQHAHRRRRSDDALRAHAGFGEPEMQRVIGAARQFGIDGDQILHRGDLGRKDDFRARQADFLGALGRQQCRLHHGFARHVARIDRIGASVSSRPSDASAAPDRASPNWRRCAPAYCGGSRFRRWRRTACPSFP